MRFFLLLWTAFTNELPTTAAQILPMVLTRSTHQLCFCYDMSHSFMYLPLHLYHYLPSLLRETTGASWLKSPLNVLISQTEMELFLKGELHQDLLIPYIYIPIFHLFSLQMIWVNPENCEHKYCVISCNLHSNHVYVSVEMSLLTQCSVCGWKQWKE